MVSINLLLLFKILLDQQWINYPPKSDPIKNIKLIDQNWMENELIFINGLVNYEDQMLDLLLANINIWELIILLIDN